MLPSGQSLTPASQAPRAHGLLLGSLRADSERLRLFCARLRSEEVEDLVYRFWHGSMKVFALQQLTLEGVDMLMSLAPEPAAPSPLLMQLLGSGTGHVFSLSDNDDWLGSAGPVVAAFLQVRWLCEAALWSAEHLEVAPVWLPSRWAAVLDALSLR